MRSTASSIKITGSATARSTRHGHLCRAPSRYPFRSYRFRIQWQDRLVSGTKGDRAKDQIEFIEVEHSARSAAVSEMIAAKLAQTVVTCRRCVKGMSETRIEVWFRCRCGSTAPEKIVISFPARGEGCNATFSRDALNCVANCAGRGARRDWIVQAAKPQSNHAARRLAHPRIPRLATFLFAAGTRRAIIVRIRHTRL